MLSHINALPINKSYTSKDQCQKFSQKNSENWRSPENDFCLVFGYWVVQKIFVLIFLNEKNQGGLYEVVFISVLWMVSSEA